MKRLLLIFILSQSLNFVQAQDFVYPIGQNLVLDVQSPGFEEYNIKITTQVPQAITFGWELVSNTLPLGWDYSLCDYTNCIVGLPSGSTMTPISLPESEAGVKAFLKLNVSTGQIYGQGKVEIYVFDINDYAQGDTVSWDLTWSDLSASLNEVTGSDILVSPNPATDFVQLKNLQNQKVFLYTMAGTLVETIENVGNEFTLNTALFERGIYLLVSETPNGQLIKQKIILN